MLYEKALVADASFAFRLNPALDAAAIGHAYRTTGRVRIDGLLADGANEMLASLQHRRDWIQLINADGRAIEMPREKWEGMSGWRRRKHEAVMHGRARDRFQYAYSAIRVPGPDEDRFVGDPLLAFARFMQSAPVQSFLCEVTGVEAPRFSHGQATAYGCGDFLTGHDDDLPNANRKAAFVFGLTPTWQAEWGGLLLFHPAGSDRIEGLIPRFNTLDLFTVPQFHSVSAVMPFAQGRRYAVTGWLALPV